MNFIYPGNLKERKIFLCLSINDLIISGILLIIFAIYAAKNYSLIPMIVPVAFIILKIRILENSSNLWEQILCIFDYIVNSQQVFFWGERK